MSDGTRELEEGRELAGARADGENGEVGEFAGKRKMEGKVAEGDRERGEDDRHEVEQQRGSGRRRRRRNGAEEAAAAEAWG